MTGLMLTMGILQLPHTLERRVLLCAVTLFSLLRIADSQLPQCSLLAAADRRDCGFDRITQAQCESSFCCYDTTEPDDAIWCYFPNELPNCATPVDGVSRINCEGAFPEITEGQCTELGCCFDDSQTGVPFCYMSTYQTAQCSNTLAPNERTACNPPGDSIYECHLVGCCYDNSFGIAFSATFCYQPAPTTVPQACQTPILPQFRISCGPLGVAECNIRGCCHDGVECYHRVGQNPLCVPIAVPLRRECGRSGISGQECALNNCCFEDSVPNVIHCYTPNQLECTNVATSARINCGYDLIDQQVCQNPSCCYDDSIPGVPFCFYPVNQVTPRPEDPDCRLGDLLNSIGDTLELWVRLVRDPPSVEGVLNKTSIFSITTYCGIYTTAIDAITGCAYALINPFGGINENFDNSFLNAMNDIQDAKGVCAAVVKQDPGRPLCVPNAHAICSLTSIDLLTTFATAGLTNNQYCGQTEEILRGVSTCIGLSTSGCTPTQQDGYADIRLQFTKIADRIATNCENCTALSYFLLDRHQSCSWNVERIFPNARLRNYCEYATRTVTCAWELWKGCPILPREYFERALSGLEQAFFVAGCDSFLPRIPDFVFFPDWEINIPPCVEAGITCAQELSYAVGVGELAGPFGGYTIDQVTNRVNTIRTELLQGNYQGLCGRPDQQTAGKNPIADCINDLFANCGGGSATMQQMTIVETTVTWYREVCTEGCARLAEKFLDFRTYCPNAEFTVAPEDIPTQLFLSQLPGVVDGVGAQSELCQNIWSYVGCISDIIEQCEFLNNRLDQGLARLVEVITGDPNDGTLPLNIHICGIRIFYPFTYDPLGTLFQLSLGPQTAVPLVWLITLAALLSTVYTMFL